MEKEGEKKMTMKSPKKWTRREGRKRLGRGWRVRGHTTARPYPSRSEGVWAATMDQKTWISPHEKRWSRQIIHKMTSSWERQRKENAIDDFNQNKERNLLKFSSTLNEIHSLLSHKGCWRCSWSSEFLNGPINNHHGEAIKRLPVAINGGRIFL